MTDVLRASLAPFLLLITPFAVFVQHQRYGLSHPDVLLFVSALAAVALLLGAGAARSPAFEVVVLAGLLTLFADVQLAEPAERILLIGFVAFCVPLWVLRRHARRIVSTMMATVLALSFLPQQRSEATPGGDGAPAGRADLPLVVHLVLDEHIGVEGLPAGPAAESAMRDLRSFFIDRGFRLFGRAYSEYSTTLWSLSHLLNLVPAGSGGSLTRPLAGGTAFRLNRSAYFDDLARQGYRIRVYQTEYLDLCTDAISRSACHTYRPYSLEALAGVQVPTRQKLRVVAGAYLARSRVHVRAKRAYRSVRRRLQANVQLPEWDWERFMPAPLGTMPMFDRIANDLARARRGEALFAHLLMPHDPYVFTTACELRAATDWVTRRDAADAIVPGGVTSPLSRAARYGLYVDQVACARQKVAQLLDAIPNSLRRDAIVVIHGDHGSRISPVDPSRDAATLAASDYADHFSTLFAVRAPGLEAGYDTRATPLACLLDTLVRSGFSSVAVDACSTSRVVYFSDGPAPRPSELPEFWAARRSAP